MAGFIMRLIGETYCDAVSCERPEFLDEAIVGFALPFSGEKLDDLFAAMEELITVSPAAIDGVGERDLLRVAAIPGVLCLAYFLDSRFVGEGRKRRPLFCGS